MLPLRHNGTVDMNEVLMVINGDGDVRHKAIISETILALAVILVVPLRFWARKASKTKIGWDDWLIIPAAVCALAWYSQLCISLTVGFGRYIGEVTYYKLRIVLLTAFISSHFYATAIGFAKLSILFLYMRAFSIERWARLYVRFLGLLTVLWMISFHIIACLQCRPLNAVWDRWIEGECNVDLKKFWLYTGIFDIITDVALMAVPMVLCTKLKLSLLNKFLLCGVFASGFLVTIVSVVRLKTILEIDLTSPDAANVTWNFAPVGILTAIDVDMAVVSACLPTLRPLIAKLIPKSMVPNSLRKRNSAPPSPVFETPTRRGLPRSRTSSDQWDILFDVKDEDFSYFASHETNSSSRHDSIFSKDGFLRKPSLALTHVRRPSLAPSFSANMSNLPILGPIVRRCSTTHETTGLKIVTDMEKHP